LWLAVNHKPVIRGTDKGIWRRVRLIPFTVEIPEEHQDKVLREKLRAEASGILNWCLRGCLDWQRDGLGEPDEVRLATREYRTSQDVIGEFLSDCCAVESSFRIKAGDLYAAYSKWAESNREFVQSHRRLTDALGERGITKRRSNGIWYEGIGLYDTHQR
jgi:putative DNA primase/helicase